MTLTETPSAGATFSGWSGACSGTGACALTLGADQSVTATFTPPTTASSGGGGSGGGGSAGGGSGQGGPGPSPGGTLTSGHTTPPGTRIVAHRVTRRTRHSAAAATFKFKATGTATRFQCALVRAPQASHGRHKHARASAPRYAACRSPKSYTRLAHGHYTFYVRAVGAGGADPTPAKLRFAL